MFNVFISAFCVTWISQQHTRVTFPIICLPCQSVKFYIGMLRCVTHMFCSVFVLIVLAIVDDIWFHFVCIFCYLCNLLDLLFATSVFNQLFVTLVGYPPGYYPGPYGAYAPSPGGIGQYTPSPGGQFAQMHPQPGKLLRLKFHWLIKSTRAFWLDKIILFAGFCSVQYYGSIKDTFSVFNESLRTVTL